MSRSFRSQKESVTAERRIERAEDGRPRLPRIIERAPAPGDLHPISKRILRRFLERVPVEFIYGLSRIELRARQSQFIGDPFGSYWIRDRAFVLYSLPPVISWAKPEIMSLWFYSYVFTHELGHHFVEQFKTKNRRIRSRNAEELVADLHAKRFTDELFAHGPGLGWPLGDSQT